MVVKWWHSACLHAGETDERVDKVFGGHLHVEVVAAVLHAHFQQLAEHAQGTKTRRDVRRLFGGIRTAAVFHGP